MLKQFMKFFSTTVVIWPLHVDILSGCILSFILCMYLFTENKISCTLIFQEIVKTLESIYGQNEMHCGIIRVVKILVLFFYKKLLGNYQQISLLILSEIKGIIYCL